MSDNDGQSVMYCASTDVNNGHQDIIQLCDVYNNRSHKHITLHISDQLQKQTKMISFSFA